MSTNLIPTNLNVPAHIAARMSQPSALGASLAGGISGGADYARISIKGSRFRIIDDGVESVLDMTALDVVIVGANPQLSKTFYEAQWDKDAEPTAPDCFSLNGISPDPESTSPQNDICATCDQNKWGSKKTPQGKDIKACADLKRLAVVAGDDVEGPVYLLNVTPSALKGLKAYQKELQMRGIAMEVVKTRITFDTDASYPKLQFGFGGFVAEADMATVDALFDDPKVKEITGEAMPAIAPVPVKKAAPKKVAAPEPEEEAEEEEAEEEAPAEAPKRGFGAKKAAEPAPKKAAPKKAAAPTDEPKAAPAADPATDALADEIAAMFGAEDDDA